MAAASTARSLVTILIGWIPATSEGLRVLLLGPCMSSVREVGVRRDDRGEAASGKGIMVMLLGIEDELLTPVGQVIK